jgi:hypothetical protein
MALAAITEDQREVIIAHKRKRQRPNSAPSDFPRHKSPEYPIIHKLRKTPGLDPRAYGGSLSRLHP